MIKRWLRQKISEKYPDTDFDILVPPDDKMGDYSTNIAFALAKKEGKDPIKVGEELVADLRKDKDLSDIFEKVEVVKPGFINFYLSDNFLRKQLGEIVQDEDYGFNETMKGKTVMVEYTDPNPFKLFHIGHLMSNAIGEAISRLYEASGARVLRANYQGDVGLHVAKAIWGMEQNEKNMPKEGDDVNKKVEFLGKAYADGALAYENPEFKEKIEEVNEKIYDRSDREINNLYDLGKKWSLEYFETIYKKLGTKFDRYFFESEAASDGLNIVEKHPDVFVESDLPAPRPATFYVYAIECDDGSIYIGQTQNLQKRWKKHSNKQGSNHTIKHVPRKLIHYEEYSTREEAVKREHELKTGFGRKWLKREYKAGRLPVLGTQTGTRQAGGAKVFRGEGYGLHTRVFVSSKGLPTYEAKELGVNKNKFEKDNLDLSIIITGNEINEYFKVLLKVMELTMPNVAAKTKHISHGMLRLPGGKMSSRTGDVITADSLIEQTELHLPESEGEGAKEKIAIGAIKYSILKQSPGHDIIFDFDKSLSVKGDSGPYLQYTYARLNSILNKAGQQSVEGSTIKSEYLTDPTEIKLMKKLLTFPDVVIESGEKIFPQHLALYLYELANDANRFYESVRVLDPERDREGSQRASVSYGVDDEDESKRGARLVLISAVSTVLKRGLNLLGIEVLERI